MHLLLKLHIHKQNLSKRHKFLFETIAKEHDKIPELHIAYMTLLLMQKRLNMNVSVYPNEESIDYSS